MNNPTSTSCRTYLFYWLFAICFVGLLTPKSASAWGSLRDGIGDYSTHGAIDLVAWDALAAELKPEALVNFPGRTAVFDQDFVAIGWTGNQQNTSTGPDYEPSTGPVIPFSYHYRAGTTGATLYYNNLVSDMKTKSATTARNAAWAAHLLADQYVPYHNLGLSYDRSTGLPNVTTLEAFTTTYTDLPADFIAASAAAGNANYDWYDPSYWDTHGYAGGTLRSTHILWERAIYYPTAPSAGFDTNFSNASGITSFVSAVQADTTSRFTAIEGAGATAVSDAARGVYTAWRSTVSAFGLTLEVKGSDTPGSFIVSADVENYDKLYDANTVQAELVLPAGLTTSDTLTQSVNSNGVLAKSSKSSTPVEWLVSGSASSGCTTEIKVKVTGKMDGDKPEAAANPSGAVEATITPPPTVEITSPATGDSVTENKVTVTGNIPEGSQAWIENGNDKIWISEGFASGSTFSKEIPLKQGVNTIVVKAVNQCRKQGSDTISITGEFVDNGIMVVMSWNTSGTDVDLHMTDSNGGLECYYSRKNPDWGDAGVTTDNPQLDIDNTSGYGPETIVIPNPKPGSYTVRVVYYSDHNSDTAIPSFVTIKVYEYGLIKGTFTNTLGDTGDTWEGVYTFTVTAASSAAASASLAATAADYSVTESRITTSGKATHPAINSSQIAWTDTTDGTLKSQIYKYNLSSSQASRVSNTSTPTGIWQQGMTGAAISDSRIVWDDLRPISTAPFMNSSVYNYNLSTSTESKAMDTLVVNTDGTSNSIIGTSRVAVSGDKMVWEDTRNSTTAGNSDIYMLDLSTNTETQITTDSNDQVDPDISGNRIVWTDTRYGGYTVFMYDLTTSTELQIAPSSTGTRNPPAIDDHLIVWEQVTTEQGNIANSDIYVYDIDTHDYTQLTSNTAEQNSPDVSGSKVVWVDHRNGNGDIYMYDTATGVEVPICTNTSEQAEPRISGNRVVWTDYRNGASNPDIYMAAISSATAPATLTTSVEANSQGGTVNVTSGTAVSINVALTPGNDEGSSADWWLVANTPYGWFSYLVNPLGWASGFGMTAQGALVNLPSYEALNMVLPAGQYIFYFGVDLLPNGILDLSTLNYDSVTVNVSP